MIISHRHRFIFIKTRKTAGTSFEIALSRFLGEDDVITPISPVDEALRAELGYRGAQNYMIPLSRYRFSDWVHCVREREARRFSNHDSAAFVRDHIDPDTWNSYFKFTFERNPWDKFISFYFWRNKEEQRPTIAEFIDSPLVPRICAYDQYSIDGKLAVDKVYRYEEIEQALRDVTERLGLPGPLEMPRTKTGFRKDARSYRDILDAAERERIAAKFSREIDSFGYVW